MEAWGLIYSEALTIVGVERDVGASKTGGNRGR